MCFGGVAIQVSIVNFFVQVRSEWHSFARSNDVIDFRADTKKKQRLFRWLDKKAFISVIVIRT
jgi:hypothetical protein